MSFSQGLKLENQSQKKQGLDLQVEADKFQKLTVAVIIQKIQKMDPFDAQWTSNIKQNAIEFLHKYFSTSKETDTQNWREQQLCQNILEKKYSAIIESEEKEQKNEHKINQRQSYERIMQLVKRTSKNLSKNKEQEQQSKKKGDDDSSSFNMDRSNSLSSSHNDVDRDEMEEDNFADNDERQDNQNPRIVENDYESDDDRKNQENQKQQQNDWNDDYGDNSNDNV